MHAHVSGGGAKREWEDKQTLCPVWTHGRAWYHNPETMTPAETKSRTANQVSQAVSPDYATFETMYSRDNFQNDSMRSSMNPLTQQNNH